MYICTKCGSKAKKWGGQCKDCGEWNSLVDVASEEGVAFSGAFGGAVGGFGGAGNSISRPMKFDEDMISHVDFADLDSHEHTEIVRLPTGIGELNNVLGGGFVCGSAILIGGDPGIGKSTLLLQTSAFAARSGLGVVYVSGEESVSQIAIRAKRLGFSGEKIKLVSTGSVMSVLKQIDVKKTDVLVIDSIQTMFMANIDSNPGTVSQVRAATMQLVGFCKTNNIILIIVGHMTKDGSIAGPKLLEHMVDVVLYFEGDGVHQFRLLRCIKNRFGNVNEIGIFSMTKDGLCEVSNPSSFFLRDNSESSGATKGFNNAGCTIFVAVEGTRPVVTEVETLVSRSFLPSPKRAVVGWDSNRLSMVVAILQTRCKITLHDKDIYVSMAGGFKTLDPANDLAVAISLMRASKQQDTQDDIVAIGEIALSGHIRNVSWMDVRVKEAVKLGYNRFILPKSKAVDEIIKAYPKIDVKVVEKIQELVL